MLLPQTSVCLPAGHCKALAPTWQKLAKQLRKVPTVTIAKIDGVANEHADLGDIKGFPHLMLYPARNVDPVVYEGDRSIQVGTWL